MPTTLEVGRFNDHNFSHPLSLSVIVPQGGKKGLSQMKFSEITIILCIDVTPQQRSSSSSFSSRQRLYLSSYRCNKQGIWK